VRGVRFSRNFGHQMAFAAGLDHARGEAVVIMDADLQDPPELIPDLVARWREGNEVVYAVRTHREGETLFKKLTASLFYRLLRSITQVPIPVDTGDFRLMGRRALEAFRRLPERHRFTRGLVAWVGFPQVGVPYARAARHAGETNYPLRKMLRFAVDAITSFSHVPLQLATWLGFITSLFAFAYIVVVVVLKFVGISWPGYTSLMAAILFLGGVQLVMIGLLGEYLGRVYDEVKGRLYPCRRPSAPTPPPHLIVSGFAVPVPDHRPLTTALERYSPCSASATAAAGSAAPWSTRCRCGKYRSMAATEPNSRLRNCERES
jgi:dolichol-phosphate mannosyltransferase